MAAETQINATRLLDEPIDIAVVDYGMGNRRSVEKALAHIGANVTVTNDHERLRAAAGLVVPGVGAFPRGMAKLCELGLDELLRERLAVGTPVLGICLGMQLGFERSTEQGGTPGLGVIGGEVRELQRGSLKLPHIGWNEVSLVGGSPLTEGLPERCAFYHVHSFAPVPSSAEDILGTSVYGAPFASVVAHESFYGVQFHPEKSSAAGLRLLANFGGICARASVPVGS
ncbi:MAG TPA: imidazole glycerol phosphate synthase subunit HisH [Solirubrobacteraceae bacterium]|jgi:glutamine amidotransferase|nr:imidazole glycerol phosphate synthase subunit HisH [Solirubrobacteraceae bacterium]